MLPATAATSRSMSAHCAAKHNSATVATERPMMMLQNQVSRRHIRGTSNTGRIERYAQPNTYPADRKS